MTSSGRIAASGATGFVENLRTLPSMILPTRASAWSSRGPARRMSVKTTLLSRERGSGRASGGGTGIQMRKALPVSGGKVVVPWVAIRLAGSKLVPSLLTWSSQYLGPFMALRAVRAASSIRTVCSQSPGSGVSRILVMATVIELNVCSRSNDSCTHFGVSGIGIGIVRVAAGLEKSTGGMSGSEQDTTGEAVASSPTRLGNASTAISW